MSIEDFVATFKKPLKPPVLLSPPRLRRTRAARARAGELDDSELVPKRSARLAAKSRHREPKPEAQARKVPDEASFDEFQTAFTLPLSVTTREAMEALFLGREVADLDGRFGLVVLVEKLSYVIASK
jgi:hypothetical protein